MKNIHKLFYAALVFLIILLSIVSKVSALEPAVKEPPLLTMSQGEDKETKNPSPHVKLGISLDVSLSTSPFLQQEKSGIVDVVSSLQIGDYLLLQIFGAGDFFLWDGEIKSKEDIEAIKKMVLAIQLSPDEGTMTIKALQKFLDKYNKAPEENSSIKIILLLTDGYCQAPNGDFEDLTGVGIGKFDRKTSLFLLFLANERNADLVKLLNREKIPSNVSDPTMSPATLKWIKKVIEARDPELLPALPPTGATESKEIGGKKSEKVEASSSLKSVSKVSNITKSLINDDKKNREPLNTKMAKPGLKGFFNTSTILGILAILGLSGLLVYLRISKKAFKELGIAEVKTEEEEKILLLSLLDKQENPKHLASMEILPRNSMVITNTEAGGDIQIDTDGEIIHAELQVDARCEVYLKNGRMTTYPLLLNGEPVRGKMNITGMSRIQLTPDRIVLAEFAGKKEAENEKHDPLDGIIERYRG